MEYFVLVLMTAVLSAAAHVVAGPHAVPPMGTNQISVQIGLVFFFMLALIFRMLGESVRLAPRFACERDGRLDIKGLFVAVKKPQLDAFLVVLVAAYGIAASAKLVEVYRIESRLWYDEFFWENERALFGYLLALPVNFATFWDVIYQVLWVVLFVGLAGLACEKKTKVMAEALCAVVFAFHLTRYIAIAFPSAGPVFHQPDLFDLSGTGSATLVPLLRAYMAGHVVQNGFLPGTQAFPSLHVGLAWCAVVVMAREWRWSLWLTLPWFALNWTATLFLGWHYIVDGIGGVAVMSVALVTSRLLVRFGSRCIAPIIGIRRMPVTASCEETTNCGSTGEKRAEFGFREGVKDDPCAG